MAVASKEGCLLAGVVALTSFSRPVSLPCNISERKKEKKNQRDKESERGFLLVGLTPPMLFFLSDSFDSLLSAKFLCLLCFRLSLPYLVVSCYLLLWARFFRG